MSGGFSYLETNYAVMSISPDHRLTLRFKPDEYAVLKAKAGDRALSSYVREVVLEKAAQRRKNIKAAPSKDRQALAQVLALLGQNELVRDFRRVSRHVEDGLVFANEETQSQLNDTEELLARIHQLLMRALGVAER